MLARVVCLCIGYICGLFQTSYLIGRKNHIDIRKHGSGNAGTTNAMRVMGKKAGALTLLGDCLKCIVAMMIARLLFSSSQGDIIMLLSLYGAAGCILGHNFPCYLHFKGGKGIAASVGLLIGLDWRVLLCAAIVFFLIFFTTHYVSLCSMGAYITAFVTLVILGNMGKYAMTSEGLMEMYIVMGALTLLAIVRHKDNILRLIHGTENKLYLSKSNKE